MFGSPELSPILNVSFGDALKMSPGSGFLVLEYHTMVVLYTSQFLLCHYNTS
jgi:hypothetical protein